MEKYKHKPFRDAVHLFETYGAFPISLFVKKKDLNKVYFRKLLFFNFFSKIVGAIKKKSVALNEGVTQSFPSNTTKSLFTK